MSALLEVKNIETYYDLIYAVRGVSLSIEEGSITAILGNNGAGKSTILKTIMGLIDDQPDKGSIEFDGRRIDGKDTEAIVRMGISYVPEGREVFEELTVRENLLMGAYTRKNRKEVAGDFDRVYRYFPVLLVEQNARMALKISHTAIILENGRFVLKGPSTELMEDENVKEFYMGVRSQDSEKGYQRWKRKKVWR